MLTESNLEHLRLGDLKTIAKSCRIKGFSTKRKPELIKLLLDYSDHQLVLRQIKDLKQIQYNKVKKIERIDTDSNPDPTKLQYQFFYKEKVCKPFVGFRFLVPFLDNCDLYYNYQVVSVTNTNGKVKRATVKKIDFTGNEIGVNETLTLVKRPSCTKNYVWELNEKQVDIKEGKASDEGIFIRSEDCREMKYSMKIKYNKSRLELYKNFLIGVEWTRLNLPGIVFYATYVVSKVLGSIYVLQIVDEWVPGTGDAETELRVQVKSNKIILCENPNFKTSKFYPGEFFKRSCKYTIDGFDTDASLDKAGNLVLHPNLLISLTRTTPCTKTSANYAVIKQEKEKYHLKKLANTTYTPLANEIVVTCSGKSIQYLDNPDDVYTYTFGIGKAVQHIDSYPV